MESRGSIRWQLQDYNTESLLLPVTPAKPERRIRTAKPSSNRAVNASQSCEDDGLEDGDKIRTCKPRQYQKKKFISLMNQMKDETNALQTTTVNESDEEESKSIDEILNKKQKRKKHRPKVIDESPRKNIEPVTPKQKNDKKIITYKRKRRSTKETTMKSVEEVMKKEVTNATSRRCLDFNLNDHPTEGCRFRCNSVREGSLFFELQKLDREIKKKPRTKIKKPRNKAASPCHHMLPARAAPKLDHFLLLYKPYICMLCLATENTPKPRTKRRTHNKGYMRPDEFDEHQYDILSWGCRKRMCFVSTKDSASASQSFMVSAQTANYVKSSKVRSYERIIHQSIEIAESADRDFDGRILAEAQTTAIVPYGGVGEITVYQGLYESTKAKERAKVDLCGETMRVWGLLMGKTEDKKSTIDPDKERFWEKERHVFKGRADAFIARMHLQQGDRRFSQWKGSVVDSIVGAFLTQNVSDHQSSSAFMALAAKFPLHPKERVWECDREELSIPRKQQEGYPSEKEIWKDELIVFHEDTVNFNNHKKIMDRSAKSSGEYIGSSETANMNTEQIYHEKDKKTSQILLQGEICEPLDTAATSWSSAFYSFSSRNLCTMINKQMKPNPTFQDTVNIIEYELIQDFSKFCTLSDEFLQLDGDKMLQKLHEDESNFVQSSTKLDHHSIGPAPLSERKNISLNTNSIQKSFPPLQSGKRKEQADNKKEQIWNGVHEDLHLKNYGEQRSCQTMDCLDYEALRRTNIDDISNTIRERGMNNLLAKRIKDFLNRLAREEGSIDLEWLRDAPPDKSREYLLSIKGLGLKSVECIRLLTLQQPAFPVDTNVGRICVRLGWVPLQPLPESLQLHLLELYPILEHVQKYLWPRLCKLDQQTLYELHYQMITFGKVFCTKNNPNCNACPMRAECKHFASAFSSARLPLPAPQEKSLAQCVVPLSTSNENAIMIINPILTPTLEEPRSSQVKTTKISYEPIIEVPASPEAETIDQREKDIEDAFWDDESSETPGLKPSDEEFSRNLQHHQVENGMELQDVDISKALVALTPAMASIPRPKLKNMCRLRTEHQVYELPDSHVLLSEMDPREPDDPSPYLLAIWTPGETAESYQEPVRSCTSLETGKICDQMTCFGCNNYREVSAQIVRGTILIPCRTATRGGFPLNGTYFQVNEVFADHESSLRPIEVPRKLIWNLPRRTVYFGTSIPTIFRGLTVEEIQQCFWRGFVCVRAFDIESRAPRPLTLRLHFPPSMAERRKSKHNTSIAE